MFGTRDLRSDIKGPGFYAFLEYKETQTLDSPHVVHANYFRFPQDREAPNGSHPTNTVYRGFSSAFPVEYPWWKIEGYAAEPQVHSVPGSANGERAKEQLAE